MAVTGTSTGVLTFTAGGDSVPDVYVVHSVRWVGGTTAGHKCDVTDSYGNVIWKSQADGANFTDGWYFDWKWANGITLATMPSGTLNLYVSARG